MRASAVVAGLGLVLGLTACTTGPPGAGGPPDARRQAEPTPHPLLALACDELVDADAFLAGFGEPLGVRAPYVEGYGGMGNVATAALALAGATRCAWGDEERYLEVDVLPAAEAEWERLEAELQMFQPQEGAHGEAAWFSCRPGERPGCRADVLAGRNWVAVNAFGLVDVAALDAVLDALVARVAAAEAATPDWPAPASIPVDCAALLPREAVHSSIGDDVEPWRDRGPVLSQTLRQAALDRAGAVHCAWRNGFGSATARTIDLVVLPGGDLVWDAHFAAPVPEWVERESFDDFGDAGFSAVHTSTFTGAIDGVVSTLSPGGAWVDVWANDEARDDDLDIAVSLAGTALQTLGP